MGLLFWVTLLPALGALLLMFVPREEEAVHRGLGLFFTVTTFLVSLGMLGQFDSTQAGFQLEVDKLWVPSLGIHFHLGVDGISLWLVLLTTFIVPVTLLSPQAIGTRNVHVREFIIAVLILETGMLGAFMALDMFLFYVFWEVMLIPMYFIIGIWGGDRRLYASIKFVLFTLVGSLLMLVAILYMYAQAHELTGLWTFDYGVLSKLSLPRTPQILCWSAFALAFAIKVPLFPLHTWLPDAHVEAPTGGSVILAAVLLKFGIYGFLRFAMPMFPYATVQMAPVVMWLAVIGIIYGALMAYVQDDLKKLVAYSSVSHLGFVVLGVYAMNLQGIEGGLYQMLAHGISTGGLFLGVGFLYDRRHSRKLDDFGGLWARVPVFAALYLVIMLASVGLPGLCGFVGEFLVLAGIFTAGKSWAKDGMPNFLGHFGTPKWLAVFAAAAVILSAMYLLGMYQKVFFGPLDKPENKDPHFKDVSPRERLVFGIVVAAALFLGLFPNTFLSKAEASITGFMTSYKTRYDDALRDPEAGAHFFPALPVAPPAGAEGAEGAAPPVPAVPPNPGGAP